MKRITFKSFSQVLRPRKVKPFFVLIGLLLVVSCVTDVSLDTNEKLINVYCILNNSDKQELYLKIFNSGDKGEVEVSDADARLYLKNNTSGEIEEVGVFKCEAPGFWTLPYTPVIRGEYILRVSVPSVGDVSAVTCTLDPNIVEFSSFGVPAEAENPIYENCDMSMFGSYVDKANLGIKVYGKENCSLWCYVLVADWNSKEVKICDMVTTDYPDVDMFNVGTSTLEEMRLKGKKVFNYLYNYSWQKFRPRNDFFLHKKYIHIDYSAGYYSPLEYDTNGKKPGKELDRTSIFRIAAVSPYESSVTYLKSRTVVIVANSDYDEYLKSARDALVPSSDFMEITSPKNSYSNVIGGCGIFGAATKTYCPHVFEMAPLNYLGYKPDWPETSY